MRLKATLAQIAVVDDTGETLVSLSTDRKTTPWMTARHSSSSNTVLPNAFGLTPIDTCPGATPACKAICYAEKNQWVSARNKWATNTNFCRTHSEPELVKAFSLLIDGFVSICEKQGVDPIFRLMSSGDFPTHKVARAWSRVAKAFPDVRFWGYTRSFHLMKHFRGIENLTIFASIDPQNRDFGDEHLIDSDRFSFMGSVPQAKKWSADRKRNLVVCPELIGNLPMYTFEGKRPTPERGSSVRGAQGACATCKACLPTSDSGRTRTSDIVFVAGRFDGAGNRHEVKVDITTGLS